MIQKHEAYFVPHTGEPSRADTEHVIVEALRGNIHKLCDIGHNAIYSALAIKALRDVPEERVSSMTEGLGELIRAFDAVRFGMYIGGKGKTVHETTLTPDDDFPVGDEVDDVVSLTLAEFLKFKQIYDLDVHKAQVGHLITHAHSLIELEELGYSDLYEAGVTPFKIKVKILRKSQDFIPPKKWRVCLANPDSPLDEGYWRQDFEQSDWDYGHTLKYNYSFHNLIERIPDPDEKAACVKHFRYMI